MEELEGDTGSWRPECRGWSSPIDKEMLASLIDNYEQVMAEGLNPKKEHLLYQLVKKVLIHSHETIEIWYALPNSQRFANSNIWLPKCNSMRTRPGAG